MASLLALPLDGAQAAWGVLLDMHHYHECFGLDPQERNYPNSGTSPKWKLQGKFKVVMIQAKAPGNDLASFGYLDAARESELMLFFPAGICTIE